MIVLKMIALGWPWIGEAASWVAAFASALEVDVPNMALMMEPFRGHVPLAVTLLATGLTVATLGWIGHPLSLGVLAWRSGRSRAWRAT